MNSSSLDALVIGAGPTGLAMAIDLKRHGMNVRIVDKAPTHTELSKATVLMPRTIEEFAARDLVKPALATGEQAVSLSAYSHGKLIFQSFYNQLQSEYSFLLHIPQSETERILRERLAELGGAVEWNTEVTAFEQDKDGVTVTLQSADGTAETLRTAWLVGSDGAHSFARHQTGIEFKGGQYDDNWLLADVKIDWRFPHGHTYLFFHNSGLFAVFPMPQCRFRIYVVEAGSGANHRPPTLEEIQEMADRFVPDGCRISDPRWLSEFRCHHRRVESYSKGRVHLAGDAAHIHSPESGLGMNTGIQDAFNLAWKIAYIQKGWVNPEIMETYNQERGHVGKEVLAMSDRTHRIWAQHGSFAEFIRDPMWRFFSNHFLHHTEQLEEAVQIRIRYPQNDFVRDVGHGKTQFLGAQPHIVAGMQADNPPIQTLAAPGECALLHQLEFTTFNLLIFTGSHADESHLARIGTFIEAIRPFRAFIRSVVIVGGQDGQRFASAADTVLLDPTLYAHFRYAAQEGGIFLVRPDLYVAYSERGLECASHFEQFLKHTMQVPEPPSAD